MNGNGPKNGGGVGESPIWASCSSQPKKRSVLKNGDLRLAQEAGGRGRSPRTIGKKNKVLELGGVTSTSRKKKEDAYRQSEQMEARPGRGGQGAGKRLNKKDLRREFAPRERGSFREPPCRKIGKEGGCGRVETELGKTPRTGRSGFRVPVVEKERG